MCRNSPSKVQLKKLPGRMKEHAKHNQQSSTEDNTYTEDNTCQEDNRNKQKRTSAERTDHNSTVTRSTERFKDRKQVGERAQNSLCSEPCLDGAAVLSTKRKGESDKYKVISTK